jgi:hypothetical protein
MRCNETNFNTPLSLNLVCNRPLLIYYFSVSFSTPKEFSTKKKKIVIFVLSAQNYCFLLAHENEFLVETGQVETSNSFECAGKIIIFRMKYKH